MTSMNKKISVVIPFYQRQEGLLNKAVVSALNQKGDFRLEIVVVDDGSPIPARKELADLIVQQPDKFIIIDQKNAGCFPAGNTALNHVSADADYIAFLDSDDEWFDGHLRHALWALERDYDLYFSDFYQLHQTLTAFNRARKIDVEQHRRIHPTEPIHEYNGDMVDQIIRGNIFGTSTIVYNRQTFKDVRYLENYKHTGPEYIFWLQLALRSAKIAFSSVPECRYGGGVNIFSESGWGTDKYLSVRHDEIKWKKYILDELPLSGEQISLVRRRIRESRSSFARGFVHNLLHNGKVSLDLSVRQWHLDPMTIPSTIWAVGAVGFEKLWSSVART
jgi:succinoglycan biosynthesis protein ExoW